MTLRLSIVLCLLSLAAPGRGASPTTAASSPARGFLDQVREHFAAWDADRDGVLSKDEIERAVDDPANKGPAAAAAAALRRAIVANPDFVPVTLDRLATSRPEGGEDDSKAPNCDAMYHAALARIDGTHRELFRSGLPHVETLAQGRLGDCFLLASLGTVAAAQPERLKKMVEQLPDGQIAVHFATGQTVTLPPPTDAEIALGARTGDDGVWANVFERAIGHVLLERQKAARHHTPFGIIGVGGSPHVPLALLTGHGYRRIGCKEFRGGELEGAEREAKLQELRDQLAEAFRAGRLVVGGTGPAKPGETRVPGLYFNHSYGILNYDPKADVVTFWNPMGNHFAPEGRPGLEHGYATSHGRFEVPLAEAVMWFGAFSIEGEEPVGK